MMKQAMSKRFFFFCLALFLLPWNVFSKELISIVSFTPLREGTDDSWIGHYVQSRMMRNFRLNSQWNLHTPNSTELWKRKSGKGMVSPLTTIQVTGNFLKVLKRGFLEMHIVFPVNSQREAVTQEVEFRLQNLDQVVDLLSERVGQQIDPDFSLKKKAVFPSIQAISTEAVFRYRVNRWASQVLDPGETLRLQDLLTHQSDPESIAELVTGLIILAKDLQGEEKQVLLKRTRKIVQDSLKRNPKQAHLQALLAELLYWQKEKAQSETVARKALQEDENSELALFLLALSQGVNSGAGKEILSKLDSISPWFRLNSIEEPFQFQHGIFGELLLKQKQGFVIKSDKGVVVDQIPEVEDFWSSDTVPEILPQKYKEQLQAAEDLLQKKKEEEGLTLLDQLVRDYPEQSKAILRKAKVHTDKKEYKQALKVLTPLPRKFPQQVEIQQAIGRNYYFLRSYGKAEDAFKAALQLNANYPPSIEWMGLTMVKMRRPKEALQFFDRYLNFDPQYAKAWCQKGLAHWNLQQWKDTVKSWEKCLELDPSQKSLSSWIEKAQRKWRESEDASSS